MSSNTTESRIIGFRMPTETVQKFKLVCVKNNVSISDVCAAFVNLVVSAHDEGDTLNDIPDRVKAVIGPVCKIRE